MIFRAYNLCTTGCLKCLVLGINIFNMVATSKGHFVTVVTSCPIFVITYLIKNINRNSSQKDFSLHRPNVRPNIPPISTLSACHYVFNTTKCLLGQL